MACADGAASQTRVETSTSEKVAMVCSCLLVWVMFGDVDNTPLSGFVW